MTRYTSTTEQDRREMLAKIGAGSLDDLFDAIPKGLRLGRPLDLPDGMSEQDVFDHLSKLAARNRHADEEVTFVGAGVYHPYVPAPIPPVAQRPRVPPPDTPHQPRSSPGGGAGVFEA